MAGPDFIDHSLIEQAQDNKNYFKKHKVLLIKNNISFVIPCNCPLNVAFVGECIPRRLACTISTKNMHTGQIKVVSLVSGISISYFGIFSCRDINIQITLTEWKFISNDRKARKIGD